MGGAQLVSNLGQILQELRNAPALFLPIAGGLIWLIGFHWVSLKTRKRLSVPRWRRVRWRDFNASEQFMLIKFAAVPIICFLVERMIDS